MNPKIERELELEQLAITMRDTRVQLEVERNGLADTAGGKSLVKRAMTDAEECCIDALDCWLETEGKKRRRSNAYKFLHLLPSDKLTYLAARIAVNGLAKNKVVYRSLVDTLANEVVMAVGAELYARKDEAGFNSLVRKLNWQPKVYVRQRMALEEFRNECVEVTATAQERLAVGATLLELFCTHTGLFEVSTYWKNPKHSVKEIAITEKGEQWLKDSFHTNKLASPHHLPMVVEPYPWTNLNDGGYLLQDLHPASFVRLKESKQPEALENADLSAAMDAVNAIQETPWRINKPILDIWRQCVGKGLAGCSTSENIPIPERLNNDHPDFTSQQSLRRDAFEARKDNTSKVCVELQKKTIADVFEAEPAIYFPHNLDFRGRIYPMAGRGAINPQGDDSGKALLEFAEGKPLGEDGVSWLFIHTQNTWGNDKISLQERVNATQENLEIYKLYALSPMEYTGWMEADKPFCFLACCYELEGFAAEGEGFLSRIPIALDGSCSGLQHFAGIMLDESTARAVNVVPNNAATSADVYTSIAEAVTERMVLLDGREAETPYPSYWRNLVSRDVVKQPVMTLSYGVTKIGMRNQIKEKCKKLVRKGKLEYKNGTTNEYAGFLAEQIQEAIGEVAGAAFSVMDWLALAAQTKAKLVDGLGGALSWTTPIGLPVTQEYYEYETQRLHVFVEGKEIKFHHRTGAAMVRKSKQKQGAAPNFVHSMDASHLMLTVNACVKEDIKSFAMIHDSFGTHAADTGVLFEVLRYEFSKMYEDDVLIQLFMEMPKNVQDRLPLPPERGNLDLSLVQDSQYFFA